MVCAKLNHPHFSDVHRLVPSSPWFLTQRTKANPPDGNGIQSVTEVLLGTKSLCTCYEIGQYFSNPISNLQKMVSSIGLNGLCLFSHHANLCSLGIQLILCSLVGQANQWNNSFHFHTIIHTVVRPKITFNSFDWTFNNPWVKLYQIIAVVNVNFKLRETFL